MRKTNTKTTTNTKDTQDAAVAAPSGAARRRPRGRGTTSVLAMMYLVLFSTMAIGFYAMTNTQSQIVGNDHRTSRSQAAAESGMEFMRYQLARVSIPPDTAPERVLPELIADLRANLHDTPNLEGHTIEVNGNTVRIPGGGGAVKLDARGDAHFRATITDWAGEIVCKVEGSAGGFTASRAITMDFSRAQRPTRAFDYAVASKGQILMRKGAVSTVTGVDPTIASMMSTMAADPAINVSGGVIGGDLSVTEQGGVSVTGGTVGGESNPSRILDEHVHTAEPPEFPQINTDVYRRYATNTYVAGLATQQNIRIPPGTNPRFNGGDTVRGIMYVEAPNTVTFRGNFNLQGFIVFENAGNSTSNILDFRGNVRQEPVPADPEFDPLRATSGVAILAPTTLVAMWGSTDSYLRGNVITGRFNFGGSADIIMDRGTLMTYDEAAGACTFNGKTILFASTGGDNMPTEGITYSTYYKPDVRSYQEVSP